MSKVFSLSDEIRQKLKILLATNKEIANDVKKLQDKFGMPWNEKMTAEEYYYLHQETAKLRIKHKLSEAFDFPLLEYMTMGNMENLKEEEKHNPFFTENKLTGEEYLVIQIYPETTIKDIQKAWPEISKKRAELLKINLKKRAKRKNLGRDLMAYRLKENGKKYNDIRKIINSKFSNKITCYQDVSKIIERLKK
jgi:hypothetical protein